MTSRLSLFLLSIWNGSEEESMFMYGKMTTNWKVTSSTFLRGIWKKLSNNFSLTWVCSSGKQSLIFLNTSVFSWVHIEPPVHESFDVPSLLWSHKDVSLSRTFAILELKNCTDHQWCHVKKKWISVARCEKKT